VGRAVKKFLVQMGAEGASGLKTLNGKIISIGNMGSERMGMGTKMRERGNSSPPNYVHI
jgi:hypothetical protein